MVIVTVVSFVNSRIIKSNLSTAETETPADAVPVSETMVPVGILSVQFSFRSLI